jgi:hypothetical protein
MKPQTLDSCDAVRGYRGSVRGAGRRSGQRQRGRPHPVLPHARRPAGTQQCPAERRRSARLRRTTARAGYLRETRLIVRGGATPLSRVLV